MENRLNYRLVTTACLLALIVVVLGAYTRLTNAGLGCPDWPGCYGYLVVPHGAQELAQAQSEFPTVPVEAAKAWTEMIHRYCAGTLALLVMSIAGVALWQRKKNSHPLAIPLTLIALVIFQAALGMWTVTLKLLPIVVMAHLLGGVAILSLLWALRLQLAKAFHFSLPNKSRLPYKPWALIALIIVFFQVALGGWVSSNYAGLACIGFPSCNGVLLPQLNLQQAFSLLFQAGVNNQGGLLDTASLVTIQMMHRFGAAFTVLYVGGLAIWIVATAKANRLRMIALALLAVLAIQFTLGILNVTHLLPLSIAVAHNAFATILLLTVVTLVYSLFAD